MPGNKASLQPKLLHEVPVLPESRTQIDHAYVPFARPVVFQLYEAVAAYGKSLALELEDKGYGWLDDFAENQAVGSRQSTVGAGAI